MEKSSFFNSVLDQNGNPDRPYLAEDYASYFASFIGNGVFPNPSNNLQVISNNNMTITIKQGKAWINGYFYMNTDDLILPIDVADGVLNRIDRIVLRLDFINREVKAKVKKGTFASSPTAPTLQRDADAYELALADVAVNKGIISISQGNITDKRLDNSLCGIVHGTVDQVDVTTLFNQYTVGFQQKELQFEQEFQTWFSTIQGQLSGDVAGNLSNQINNLAGAGRTTETVKGNADAIQTLTSQVGDITTVQLPKKVNSTDLAKTTSGSSGAKSVGVTTISGLTGNDVQTCLANLFQFASDGKTKWATIVGSPLLATDTFQQLNDKTQTIKNTLATNLTSKGQSSVGTDTLTNLVNKVASINVGKRNTTGSITKGSADTYTVSGLPFRPSIVVIKYRGTYDAVLMFLTDRTQFYNNYTMELTGAYGSGSTTANVINGGGTLPKNSYNCINPDGFTFSFSGSFSVGTAVTWEVWE